MEIFLEHTEGFMSSQLKKSLGKLRGWNSQHGPIRTILVESSIADCHFVESSPVFSATAGADGRRLATERGQYAERNIPGSAAFQT